MSGDHRLQIGYGNTHLLSFCVMAEISSLCKSDVKDC